MAWTTKPILRDVLGNAIAQHWDPFTDDYKPFYGQFSAEGLKGLAINIITITGTEVELKIGAAPLTNRRQLMIFPPAAGLIYFGPTGVSATEGIPLTSTDEAVNIYLDPLTPFSLFAINDGTDRDIRVVEIA